MYSFVALLDRTSGWLRNIFLAVQGSTHDMWNKETIITHNCFCFLVIQFSLVGGFLILLLYFFFSINISLCRFLLKQAMTLEQKALIKNNTWIWFPSCPIQNVIECKWLYRLKYKPESSIKLYKAQLVTIGFHQSLGVDNFEMFSPVVKPTTIRVVLTLALIVNFSNADISGIQLELVVPIHLYT